MSAERVFPPVPGSPIDKELATAVRNGVNRETDFSRSNLECLLIMDSLHSLRRPTDEWMALFGDTDDSGYKVGVALGIDLVQQHRANYDLAFITDHAAQWITHQGLNFEMAENPVVEPNPQFTNYVSRMLSKENIPNITTSVQYARSLFYDQSAVFQTDFARREPGAASVFYKNPIFGHKTKDALVTLGIMDTLDTFRAASAPTL